MGNGSLRNRLQAGGHGQVPAKLIQFHSFHFAALDRLSLAAHHGGQLADHQADGQQTNEGKQVFGIGHGQGQARRHKEIIESHHGQNGNQDGRAAAQVNGCHYNREQKDDDQIGWMDVGSHQSAETAGSQHQQQPEHIAAQGTMRPPAFHDPAGLLRFCFAADDIYIDLAAHADQAVHG